MCFRLYTVRMNAQLSSITIGMVKQSSSWTEVIVVYW